MPGKPISLSVRLSPDEAAFLAGYNPPGATTLSEKLRVMIAETQRNHADTNDFPSSLAFYEERMSGSVRKLREAENEAGCHSELLAQFTHWLPEANASFTANVPDDGTESLKDRLLKLEAETTDKIFTMFEHVLRLAVTGDSPCYNPDVINNRIAAVVKLSELIKISNNQK